MVQRRTTSSSPTVAATPTTTTTTTTSTTGGRLQLRLGLRGDVAHGVDDGPPSPPSAPPPPPPSPAAVYGCHDGRIDPSALAPPPPPRSPRRRGRGARRSSPRHCARSLRRRAAHRPGILRTSGGRLRRPHGQESGKGFEKNTHDTGQTRGSSRGEGEKGGGKGGVNFFFLFWNAHAQKNKILCGQMIFIFCVATNL